MLLLIVICVALGFNSMNWTATAIAFGLWVTVHPLLVWMGKVDPQLVAIYRRSQRYPGYIPPFTTPFRKHIGYRIQRSSWRFWRA